MKKYYEHELKKDRLALEMAMVGFEVALEDAQAAIIKPDTIEEKMRAIGELKFAIEVLEYLYRSVTFSTENLASYVTKTAPAPTEIEQINAAREESAQALLRTEKEAQA